MPRPNIGVLSMSDNPAYVNAGPHRRAGRHEVVATHCTLRLVVERPHQLKKRHAQDSSIAIRRPPACRVPESGRDEIAGLKVRLGIVVARDRNGALGDVARRFLTR
jgi:hypothetical protein